MGISCHQPAWEKGMRISSCADAISKAIGTLKKLDSPADNSAKAEKEPGTPSSAKVAPVTVKLVQEKDHQPAGACPDCGGSLQQVEGCLVCASCGYSKC